MAFTEICLKNSSLRQQRGTGGMRRLLSYLKPHRWVMVTAAVLVLLIIVVELYRPVIIGDAIDKYINGSYVQMMEEGTLTLTQDELIVLKMKALLVFLGQRDFISLCCYPVLF